MLDIKNVTVVVKEMSKGTKLELYRDTYRKLQQELQKVHTNEAYVQEQVQLLKALKADLQG